MMEELSTPARQVLAAATALQEPPYLDRLQKACGLGDAAFKQAIDELVATGKARRCVAPTGSLLYLGLR